MTDIRPIKRMFWITLGFISLGLSVAVVAKLFDPSVSIIETFALPELFVLTLVCICMLLAVMRRKIRTVRVGNGARRGSLTRLASGPKVSR